MGDMGVKMLAKALQINTKLRYAEGLPRRVDAGSQEGLEGSLAHRHWGPAVSV